MTAGRLLPAASYGEETNMEVILREHVDNLGKRGEVVKVAPGYARNFLLPRKLALPVNDGNRKFTPAETGIPGIGFTIGDLNGRTDDTYSYQIADNLSVIHGKHSMKTGVLIVHAAMNRFASKSWWVFTSRAPSRPMTGRSAGFARRIVTGEAPLIDSGCATVNRYQRSMVACWTGPYRTPDTLPGAPASSRVASMPKNSSDATLKRRVFPSRGSRM